MVSRWVDAWRAYKIGKRTPLRKVKITRDPSEDAGTFGVLTTDSGFSCYSGELPWRENKTGISCIPPGVYKCEKREFPKHGKVYEVLSVPGRTAILVHKGNYCGDRNKGLKSDVEGCLILGNAIGKIGKQKALLSSRDALARFEADLDGEPFELTIV